MRSLFVLVIVFPLIALFELGCREATLLPAPEVECVENLCPCSEEGIRAAIAQADGRYTFDCNGPTTVVTQAEIDIDNDVVLDGEGNLTVDGDEDHRVFSVMAGVTTELRSLEVTGGFAFGDEDKRGAGIHNEGTMTVTNSAVFGNNAEEHGGGIYNEGTMTVTNSIVSGNSAGGDRDCRTDQVDMTCYEGGGIWSSGTLAMMNSTVSGNTAHFGGGITNRLGTLTMMDSTLSENAAEGCRVVAVCSSGGGLWNSGTLTMTNSTVSGNTATAGGGGISNRGVPTLTHSTVSENTAGIDGGGILNFETLTMTNSTVSGNTAGQSGGGISNVGDMLRVNSSTVSGNTAAAAGGALINRLNADAEITNSTLSGNTAEIWGGAIWNLGDLLLASSTVARNAAPTASGIYDAASPDMGSVSVSGTLIEGDCADTLLDSNGYNIESPADTCGFDQEGDQANVTADQLNLGPLQDNDGPTETHALQTVPVTSAAIDQIPEADCVDGDGKPLRTDQRGEPRPAVEGSECDLGAFEVQP